MVKTYKILRIVLPVLGLFLGGIKILGLGLEVETFARFNLGEWFRYAFGVAQAVFGVIIIFPALELAGIVGSIGLLVLAAALMVTNGMALLALVPCLGIATIMVFAKARQVARKAGS